MKCPNCGAEIPDDLSVCIYCGEKTSEAKTASGKKLRPRDEDFDIIPTVKKKAGRTAPEDHDQKNWVILLILLSGIFVAVISIIIYSGAKKNHRTTVPTVAVSSESRKETESSATTLAAGETSEEETESPEETGSTEEGAEEEAPSEDAGEETLTETEEETPAEETASEETPVPESVPEETDAPVETEYGGVIYRIENGTATLIRCYSADTIMEMPQTVYGVPCTAIGEEAFSGCLHLQRMDLPEGYISIAENAFSGCVNLVEIVLPDSLNTIAGNAFSGCEDLTVVSHSGTFAYSFAMEKGYKWDEGQTLKQYRQ